MATGKVARRTAVADVAALLDSPEVASLVAELDALRWTGRKGYGVRALVGACLVKSLFALPTWTRVVALIDEHPGLREVLGASPSIWACYRFANKLREQKPILDACLDRVAAALHAENPDMGRDVAIDASGGWPHDRKRKAGLSPGPRESTTTTNACRTHPNPTAPSGRRATLTDVRCLLSQAADESTTERSGRWPPKAMSSGDTSMPLESDDGVSAASATTRSLPTRARVMTVSATATVRLRSSSWSRRRRS